MPQNHYYGQNKDSQTVSKKGMALEISLVVTIIACNRSYLIQVYKGHVHYLFLRLDTFAICLRPVLARRSPNDASSPGGILRDDPSINP
jgi:hypothetical protein